jgi:hypothetical protein
VLFQVDLKSGGFVTSYRILPDPITYSESSISRYLQLLDTDSLERSLVVFTESYSARTPSYSDMPLSCSRPPVIAPIRSRSRLLFSKRHAQTATQAASNETCDTMAESSSAASIRQAEKDQQQAAALAYRFPKVGRRGGPPDPFDILGVTHSTSDRDIKKECESL